ncbi:MAG: tetratricopeptide repeat protein [Anaerolineae bacterium]|nr:tetratricopeptide repeat protein [Anaerolineae bacterium]
MLVVAIAFFGLAALDDAFRSRQEPREMTLTRQDVQPEYRYNYTQPVTPVEPQTVLTAYDYFVMALNNQQNGEYWQAIEDYTRAIELDPTIAAAWLNRGVAYEQLGRTCAARKDFWEWVSRNTIEFQQAFIETNSTITLEMAQGRSYVIPFTARAGDVIRLDATSLIAGEPGTPGVVDPLLLLLSPSGMPVAADDDTIQSDGSLINMNASLNDYMIMQDGTYTIVVTHAGGGASGAFNLSLNLR